MEKRPNMPRIVKVYKKKPFELHGPHGTVQICQCGLSKKMPFCDSSHKACIEEDDDKTYRYTDEGEREEVSDS